MGLFGKKSRAESKQSTTTLIAKGCNITGQLRLVTDMQVDGVIDGQVHVEKTLIVSRSGRVTGEIYAGKIIVNGIVDGSCYASSIEILENGSVTGTIYTDDLCIERGGKFKGDTHPAVKDEVIEIVKESDKPKLDQKAKEKQA